MHTIGQRVQRRATSDCYIAFTRNLQLFLNYEIFEAYVVCNISVAFEALKYSWLYENALCYWSERKPPHVIYRYHYTNVLPFFAVPEYLSINLIKYTGFSLLFFIVVISYSRFEINILKLLKLL